MKKCTVCEKELPIDVFYKKRSNRDGLSDRCIPCEKLYCKGWRKKAYKKRSYMVQEIKDTHEKGIPWDLPNVRFWE